MVDSRDKGKRAEYQIRDVFRNHTGLNWERVPGSGGFSASHGLKGDIYVPGEEEVFCIEVKHYKEETLNSLLLKNPDNQLAKFWAQTRREAEQVGKRPLLIFKKDRGVWLVAVQSPEDILPELMYTNEFREDKHKEAEIDSIYLYMFNDWLATKTKDNFIK
jgi:Holliday junction resolvase